MDTLSIALQTRTPTLVWGPPGVGKTQYVEGLGRALGLHVEVVIASIREPSDFGGLPILENGGVRLPPPGLGLSVRKSRCGNPLHRRNIHSAPGGAGGLATRRIGSGRGGIGTARGRGRSGGGSVLVELQDAYGRPISGFTESDASFLCGNSVRMPVSWGEQQNVSSLSGRPIKIRFVMRDCKLYAFRFSERKQE